MHKQNKRILTCLLAAGLVTASLAGCGSASKDSSATQTTSSAESTADKAADTAAETESPAAETTAVAETESTAAEAAAAAETESPAAETTAVAETESPATETAVAVENATESSDVPEVTGTETIAAEVVVERQTVDTSAMIPVEYSTEFGSIGLYIPADWTYRIDDYESGEGSFSISIQPEGEEGDLMLSFMADGSDLTDGSQATEVGAEMYGYTGEQGTYETASVWSYFRCKVNGDSYEINNNAGDFWWAEKEDTANQVLSTIVFGQPLTGSTVTAEQGEEFTVNGQTVTVDLAAADADSTAETDAENQDGDAEESNNDGGALCISCGEQSISLVDFSYGTRAIDVLPVSDTVSYILVQADLGNDYSQTFLVKADTSATEFLTLCDSLEAGISDTEVVTACGFALEFRVNCLGSYSGTRHYTIYQDKFYTNDEQLHFQNASGSHMDVWSNTADMDGESLDNLSKLYTEDGRMCLTLKTDLKAYSSGGEEVTIPAGTQICPTDVNLETHEFYFDFMAYDEAAGAYLTNYGYLTYDTDETGYQITIDGTDQNDVFESLPYAG